VSPRVGPPPNEAKFFEAQFSSLVPSFGPEVFHEARPSSTLDNAPSRAFETQWQRSATLCPTYLFRIRTVTPFIAISVASIDNPDHEPPVDYDWAIRHVEKISQGIRRLQQGFDERRSLYSAKKQELEQQIAACQQENEGFCLMCPPIPVNLVITRCRELNDAGRQKRQAG
jgi:hypothetical protein